MYYSLYPICPLIFQASPILFPQSVAMPMQHQQRVFLVSYCAIPIGWVIRFLPWITGKYGDTKIFVLVVLVTNSFAFTL